MLRILQINCLDLFLFLDILPSKKITDYSEEEWQKLTSSLRGIKPLDKTQRLAKLLLKTKADIIVLNEVGGKESLDNFNKYFLKEKFNVAIADGISTRGIDTGFLVKKGIDFSCKGYNEVKVGDKKYKFSRTVNKLSIKNGEELVLNIFGVHLKSKRNGPNDHGHIEARYKEVQALVKLANNNHKKYKVPYVIAGDFNGNAGLNERDFEFDSIYENTDLLDIHDLKNSSTQDRYSHIYFEKSRTNYNQLDYIFLSKDLQPKLSRAKRWLYEEKDGLVHVVTMTEKIGQPSDHYPQMAYLRLKIK